MLKTYIISVNSVEAKAGFWMALEQYLKDSKDVKAYWNYIPLTYMIKSEKLVHELTNKLRMILGDAGFIIGEIIPDNTSGYLIGPAWDWLYTDHSKPVPEVDWLKLLEPPKKK